MNRAASGSGRYEQRFTYIGPLGQGGMGRVVRAHDRLLGREVALKLVPLAGRDAVQIERFRREGEVAARLDHAGIVKVHTAGVIGQEAYLAYELVEGARPLDEAFRTATREQRLAWVLETARALAHAHERGVIHRDVKPGNVLVDREGRVRVTDFGLARATGLTPLTREGAVMGTPLWLAPEGFGGQPLDARGDTWALGVILYQALVDLLPFQGQSLTELAAQVAVGRPRAPRAIDPDVPLAVEEVCLLALRADPAARPADAGAFAALLEAALEGRRPPGAGRRRWPMALALLAVSAALLGFLALRGGEQPPGPEAGPTASAGPAEPRRPTLAWSRASGQRRFARLRSRFDCEETGTEPASSYRLDVELQELVRAVEGDRAELTLRAKRIKIELRAIGVELKLDDQEVDARHPVKRLVDQPFLARHDLRSGAVAVEGLTRLRSEALARTESALAQVLGLATEPLTDLVFGAYLQVAWCGAPPGGRVPEGGTWRLEHGITPWPDKRVGFEAVHALQAREVVARVEEVRDLPGSAPRHPMKGARLSLSQRWNAAGTGIESSRAHLRGADLEGVPGRSTFEWAVEWELAQD